MLRFYSPKPNRAPGKRPRRPEGEMFHNPNRQTKQLNRPLDVFLDEYGIRPGMTADASTRARGVRGSLIDYS